MNNIPTYEQMMALMDKSMAQRELDRQERERYWQEINAQRELDRQKRERDWQEIKQQMKETDRKFKELGLNVAGISDSNGMFAEEYFFNSLESKLEFAGINFDNISRDFNLLRKTPDGKRIRDQFDIVLLNGEAVALIEIKYKARNDDLSKMINQKIPNFKYLFPQYAKHKIYLGVGGFSFDRNVVKKAKDLGIGLLKQVGETIEYKTSWVRAY
jgi:hypothetical protein